MNKIKLGSNMILDKILSLKGVEIAFCKELPFYRALNFGPLDFN